MMEKRKEKEVSFFDWQWPFAKKAIELLVTQHPN
jgi:hypothetical protein